MKSGKDIDVLIHEHVFGIPPQTPNQFAMTSFPRSYSADREAALLVEEKILRMAPEISEIYKRELIEMRKVKVGQKIDSDERSRFSREPHAICAAALVALGLKE
ncbi:MAG: hypothetical protein HY075_10565 [Deltaproteobacteria bacterium]|nr:hypothetical protein [Deltaproteobacteria bacterium]